MLILANKIYETSNLAINLHILLWPWSLAISLLIPVAVIMEIATVPSIQPITVEETLKNEFISSPFSSPQAALQALLNYSNHVGFVPISNGIEKRADGSQRARIICKVRPCQFAVVLKRQADGVSWQHYTSNFAHSEHPLTPVTNDTIPGSLRRRASRVPNDAKEDIIMFLKAGASMKTIIQLVSDKYGMKISAHQVRDLKIKPERCLPSQECEMLAQYLYNRQVQDSGFRMALQTGAGNQFKSCVFMTEDQIRTGKAYNDVLIMDTTFGLSTLNLKVLVICCIDHHFKSQAIATAFLVDETADSFTWALTHIFEFLGGRPVAMISDRDKGMILAMTRFPDIAHINCLWHIDNNLRSHGCKKEVIDLFWLLGKATTLSQYEELLASGREKFDKASIAPIEELHLRKNNWARHHVARLVSFIPLSTQRVESLNSLIKKTIDRKLSPLSLLLEVEALIKRLLRERASITTIPEPTSLVRASAIQKSLWEYYSRGVFKEFPQQAFGLIAQMELSDKEENVVLVERKGDDDERVKVVSRSPFVGQCTCNVSTCFRIICKHIIAVAINCRATSFGEAMLNPRWAKSPVINGPIKLGSCGIGPAPLALSQTTQSSTVPLMTPVERANHCFRLVRQKILQSPGQLERLERFTKDFLAGEVEASEGIGGNPQAQQMQSLPPVANPQVVPSKGRKPKRLQSISEKIAKKAKAKKGK